MATKIHERYTKTSEKLETLRQVSRTARTKLIAAIMCDEKDVLASSDLNAIQKALARFLRVQKQLGKAFFQESNAFAKVLWKVVDQPIDNLLD